MCFPNESHAQSIVNVFTNNGFKKEKIINIKKAV